MKALKIVRNNGSQRPTAASSQRGRDRAYLEALASSARLISEFRRQSAGNEEQSSYSWGSMEEISKTGANIVRHVEVRPGRQMSFGRERKHGHFISIVSGAARVLVDDELTIVRDGESVFIPKDTHHIINNPGSEPLQFIEVSVLHSWQHQGSVNLN